MRAVDGAALQQRQTIVDLFMNSNFIFICFYRRIVCVFLSRLRTLRNVRIIAQQGVRIHLKINVDWRAHESSTDTEHGQFIDF